MITVHPPAGSVFQLRGTGSGGFHPRELSRTYLRVCVRACVCACVLTGVSHSGCSPSTGSRRRESGVNTPPGRKEGPAPREALSK